MWISTHTPWSSLSVFPHLMTSSFAIPLRSSPRSRPTRSYQINQDDHAFKLRLDVPGAQLEDLNVEVKDQNLQISIQIPSEESESIDAPASDSQNERSFRDHWIFNELNDRTTSYEFTLPTSVKSDQIQAEFKNGQLFLTLPKSQPLTHNIKIQHGA